MRKSAINAAGMVYERHSIHSKVWLKLSSSQTTVRFARLGSCRMLLKTTQSFQRFVVLYTALSFTRLQSLCVFRFFLNLSMKAGFIAPTFIGSAFAAAVSIRDLNGPCAPTSKSTAPAPLLDTLAGFYEWNGYHLLALNARAPAGYETTLANGNCSINSSRYMMYTKLQTYDVQTCADLCDVHRGCDACELHLYPPVHHFTNNLAQSQYLYPA